MTKKKPDPFSNLLDWLENGGNALDSEMEAELAEVSPLPVRKAKKKGKNKEKQTASKPKSAKKPAKKAYADSWWYRLMGVAVCIALIGLLLFAALHLPRFGSADTLIDSEVTAFYVENTLEDTGALNIVTGIILDYRGFDTLGESHVLFIAVCAVLLMLSVRGERNEQEQLNAAAQEQKREPSHDVILQSVARILCPLTLIFGLYIIFNGHLSPGGGFSGGAILGAGLILYQNAFGYEKTERFFTYKTFRFVSVAALLFYSAAKGYHFFTGANGIENGIPTGNPGDIFSAGLLLPLNIAVGCVVACTMYALYTMFRKGEF